MEVMYKTSCTTTLKDREKHGNVLMNGYLPISWQTVADWSSLTGVSPAPKTSLEMRDMHAAVPILTQLEIHRGWNHRALISMKKEHGW